MQELANSWEFKHTTSSPEFPQTNGQAERAIQTVKCLLKKAQDSHTDPYIALLDYRNTSLDGVGHSPAQLLMGKRLKTKLPVSKSLLKPQVYKHVQSMLINRQSKQKSYFKELPEVKEPSSAYMRCRRSCSIWLVICRERLVLVSPENIGTESVTPAYAGPCQK